MPTKKAVYETLDLKCSYKTLAVSLNRWYHLGIIILILIMKINRNFQHIIKHLNSTDIPVCLFKNANSHKTMKGLASFGRSSKGTYFGLKMHIIVDYRRQLLAITFTSANVDDRKVVIRLSKDLMGLFIADAGYISKKLSGEFYIEHKRILLAKPKKNMKKIMTKFEELLYQTRMLIELNFRSMKMFYNLITSMPRSIDGYFAN
ncbi:MAG: transposase [Minisyncoccia bacterium]